MLSINNYTFFLFKYCFYKDTGRLLRRTFNRFKIVVNFHETRLLRMYAKCTEIDEPPILHLISSWFWPNSLPSLQQPLNSKYLSKKCHLFQIFYKRSYMRIFYISVCAKKMKSRKYKYIMLVCWIEYDGDMNIIASVALFK